MSYHILMHQVLPSNYSGVETKRVSPAPENARPDRPEFIRLPKTGVEFYTGLTRSKLNALILPCAENGGRPPVRSVCLRQPGRQKGVRLIHLQSLLDYLSTRIEGGEEV
ncbi:MAG: hypothetical protein WDO13_17800 [Verrucomicrobiota bacterium]